MQNKAGDELGFTYVAILMAIAVIGIMLAAVGTIWSTQMQREREAELLFAGDAIRHAIERYYLSPAAGVHQYPSSLEDLLEDRRTVVAQHYLRRIYRDPMFFDSSSSAGDRTGEGQSGESGGWQLLRTADGGIYGVYSSSQRRPIKRANFKRADTMFVDSECYCDWKFAFNVRRRAITPVAKSGDQKGDRS